VCQYRAALWQAQRPATIIDFMLTSSAGRKFFTKTP